MTRTANRRTRRYLSALALMGLLAGCASPQVATAPPAPVAVKPAAPQVAAAPTNLIRVPLVERNGVPVVEVCIVHVCGIPFVVDSGASDVSVSPEVFGAMVRGGHITEADIIGVQQYRLADNSVVKGLRFRMPVMSIGGREVRGVVGSVTPGTSSHGMLLGGSFLRRFKSFSFDLSSSELVLG